jgi:GMP synthase (glutamine-hydrolysing)
MKKVMVLQHVSFELLGTLNPLLKSAGFRIKYVNFSRNPHSQPNLKRYNALIVLGGPMNVDEIDKYPHLLIELEVIREAIHKGIPILGICLGAQLLAKALGAEVSKNQQKEIGWYDVNLTDEGKKDPLFSLLSEQEKIFQWHGDTFTLPEQAVLLATTAGCTNQAFRYRDNIYGLQFHLEADVESINRWLSVPIHLAELETVKSYIDPNQIRLDTQKHIQHSLELSTSFFARFIEMFSTVNKHTVFRSR